MTKIDKRVENENLVKTAIATYNKEKNYGPSFRDLAVITDLSVGTVHAICRELRDRGVVEYIDNVARTLRVKKGK